MSTSSCRTVKRCASSFARSSTSPTRRSSRAASAAITVSDAARSSSSVTTPSRSASTWPRIAVSGVRSSCETVIRKLRSSSSASASLAAISPEPVGELADLARPGHSGTLDVVVARARPRRRRRESSQHGRGDPARAGTRRTPPRRATPPAKAISSRSISASQRWLRTVLRLRDHDRPEDACPDPQAAGPPRAASGRSSAGGTGRGAALALRGDARVSTRLRRAQRRNAGRPCPGKGSSAGVVDPVAASRARGSSAERSFSAGPCARTAA